MAKAATTGMAIRRESQGKCSIIGTILLNHRRFIETVHRERQEILTSVSEIKIPLRVPNWGEIQSFQRATGTLIRYQ